MAAVRPASTITGMHSHLDGHHPLCTIELIAAAEATRCPGERCAFWDRGCIFERSEGELDANPDVARLLVDLRRVLESAGRAA
jgi:hypothetical protein